MKLPDELRTSLFETEWANATNLRGRLTGLRSFPITKALGAPSGNKASANLERFRSFVLSWDAVEPKHLVCWEVRQLRGLGQQRVPTHIRLPSMDELAAFVGGKMQQQWVTLRERIQAAPSQWQPAWRLAAPELLAMDQASIEQINRVLLQLETVRGGAPYLRGLPFRGVGTKVVESHLALINKLADAHTNGEVSEAGGLIAWLGVNPKPSDWLLVRALDDAVADGLCGVSTLRMSGQSLRTARLPGNTLFVVENEISVLALPAIPGGLAVGGSGGNLQWIADVGPRFDRVIYWGDIDVDGLALLSQARALYPPTVSMLMDEAIVTEFGDLGYTYPAGREYTVHPEVLTPGEMQALAWAQRTPRHRLEQEKLSATVITQGVEALCRQ